MSTFVEFDTGPLQAAIEAALFNVAHIQRRDRFAAAALTGFCACPRCHENVAYDAQKYAHSAVEFADALIAELDAQAAGPDLLEARRRLQEIEDLVEGEVDVDDGVPNLAARIAVIAKGQDRP